MALLVPVVAGSLMIACSGPESCAEWQERYREAEPASGGGVLDYVNQGPLAELRADRPEGCPIP